MKNIKRNFKTATLTSLVFLSVLFANEYILRFALPDFNPNNNIRFEKSSNTTLTLGAKNKTFRLIKNSGDYNVTVKFNEYGFRDDKDIKDAKLNDLIVVGDSFAMGWGVEQKQGISELLQKLINKKIYNISVPADVTGYQSLLRYAESLGAEIKDVVLAINMQNDIANYDDVSKKILQLNPLPPQKIRYFQRLKNFLLQNSCLYFTITSIITQNDILRNVAFKMGLMLPMDYFPARKISYEQISSTVSHLRSIANKYNLIVLVIPTRGLWIGSKVEEERKIHETFISELKKQKMNYVDMRKHQEQNKNPMSFHFKNDGHWSPKGHLLAASAISAKFFSNNSPQ